MEGDERDGGKGDNTRDFKKPWLIWDELNMSVIPNSKLSISFIIASLYRGLHNRYRGEKEKERKQSSVILPNSIAYLWTLGSDDGGSFCL